MDMIGKVRRMKLRDQLSLSDRKAHRPARNTVKKWLKAPGEAQVRTHWRRGQAHRFRVDLHQPLTTDSHRPKQAGAAAAPAQTSSPGLRRCQHDRSRRIPSVRPSAFVPLSFELATSLTGVIEAMVVGGCSTTSRWRT
jgi:hypothetical protein